MAGVSDDVNGGRSAGAGVPAGDDARSRLLRAAVEAFATRGFHGTTTRDIAAGAGMSPAALYVHHRSKEEVLYAISRHGHRQALGVCERAVGAGGTATEQVARLVHDFVRHHAEHPTVARIVNYELAALAPDHRAEIDALRDRMDGLVRSLVERGCDSGEFTTSHPVMTAAALLSLGIDVARWYQPGRGWAPADVAEHYSALALRMVGSAGSSVS